MKFTLRKASDWDWTDEGTEIEIDDLEDLMKFVDINGRIVLSDGEILIYDAWIE